VPRLKLTQEATTQLSMDTEGLRLIRPGVPKFNYPLTGDQYCADPVPVRWIYILAPHQEDHLSVTSIRGMDRLRPLLTNTYRFRFLDGMAMRPTHLEACGRNARQTTVKTLARPTTGIEPSEVADLLLSDLALPSRI
jgi:hypothetical protein